MIIVNHDQTTILTVGSVTELIKKKKQEPNFKLGGKSDEL
jgi:hypothetical protein